MFISIAGIGIETNATGIGILLFGILVRTISSEEHFYLQKQVGIPLYTLRYSLWSNYLNSIS